MSSVYEQARALAKTLRESEEYAQFTAAREAAFGSDATKALIKQYHQLQMQAQAAALTGKKDEQTLGQLQRLGELLQMDAHAAAYLMAEYRLNSMLGEVYKLLGEAVDVDLGALENA